MPPKAKWSTTSTAMVTSTSPTGTFTLTAPIVDSGVKQADLVVTITAGRAVRIEWLAVPGSAPITDLQAWSREA